MKSNNFEINEVLYNGRNVHSLKRKARLFLRALISSCVGFNAKIIFQLILQRNHIRLSEDCWFETSRTLNNKRMGFWGAHLKDKADLF